MNVTVLIDDPVWFEECFKELLTELWEQEPISDMKSYSAKYKGKDLDIYVCNSFKEDVVLKAESLFFRKDIGVMLTLGYCYLWDDNNGKVSVGDTAVASSVRCDDNYVSALNLELANKKLIELDKRWEKRIVDAAKGRSMNFKTISCFSALASKEVPKPPEGKNSCVCFDHKSFALYDMAQRYNRTITCFYRVRGLNTIDIDDYLINDNKDASLELSKLVLDFAVKVNV